MTGTDFATSVVVGTSMAFITAYFISLLFNYAAAPKKSIQELILQQIIEVLHRQGALNIISNCLVNMNHPDADLFANVNMAVNFTKEDFIVNEWIVRALFVLSANINNRIDSIKLTNNADISIHMDIHYETDTDADADESDGTSGNVSTDADTNTNEETTDESDEEDAAIASGTTSPTRMARALTHYSGSSEPTSNDMTASSLSDASASSKENDGIESDESGINVEAPISGESTPIESINSTNESNTDSVEQSGNSENTSENS